MMSRPVLLALWVTLCDPTPCSANEVHLTSLVGCYGALAMFLGLASGDQKTKRGNLLFRSRGTHQSLLVFYRTHLTEHFFVSASLACTLGVQPSSTILLVLVGLL